MKLKPQKDQNRTSHSQARTHTWRAIYDMSLSMFWYESFASRLPYWPCCLKYDTYLHVHTYLWLHVT